MTDLINHLTCHEKRNFDTVIWLKVSENICLKFSSHWVFRFHFSIKVCNETFKVKGGNVSRFHWKDLMYHVPFYFFSSDLSFGINSSPSGLFTLGHAVDGMLMRSCDFLLMLLFLQFFHLLQHKRNITLRQAALTESIQPLLLVF